MYDPGNKKDGTKGRREERIIVALPVELVSLYQSMSNETTSTQNISAHGARVTTHRVWEPGSFLEMRCLQGDFAVRARVVYWKSFSSSRFTIGLEFLSHQGCWPINKELRSKAARHGPVKM